MSESHASDGDEEYVCDACDEAFDSEAELEEHLREQGLVD